jgi:hypothetical protein
VYELFLRKVLATILIRIVADLSNNKNIPFFENGLCMKVRDSFHVRIGQNDSFEEFKTYMPGYGYLKDYLPNKKLEEYQKWFLIYNPVTTESVEAIAKDLEKKGRYSVSLTKEDKEELLRHTEEDMFLKSLSPWQKWCWERKIFWYQDLDGQKTINMKKVSFCEMTENGPRERKDEMSPGYPSNYVEYSFTVKAAEDISGLTIDVEFSLSGLIENPFIADLEHKMIFNRINSLVVDKGRTTVSKNKFFTLDSKMKNFLATSHDPGLIQQQSEISENIGNVFAREIAEELERPENYSGFKVNPSSISIYQVEAVGEYSKNVIKTIIETYVLPWENNIKLEKERNQNLITKERAQAKSDAQKLAVEGQKAEFSAELEVVQNLGGDINEFLRTKALSYLNQGGSGINLNTLDINKILNQSKPSKQSENEENFKQD